MPLCRPKLLHSILFLYRWDQALHQSGEPNLYSWVNWFWISLSVSHNINFLSFFISTYSLKQKKLVLPNLAGFSIVYLLGHSELGLHIIPLENLATPDKKACISKTILSLIFALEPFQEKWSQVLRFLVWFFLKLRPSSLLAEAVEIVHPEFRKAISSNDPLHQTDREIDKTSPQVGLLRLICSASSNFPC